MNVRNVCITILGIAIIPYTSGDPISEDHESENLSYTQSRIRHWSARNDPCFIYRNIDNKNAIDEASLVITPELGTLCSEIHVYKQVRGVDTHQPVDLSTQVPINSPRIKHYIEIEDSYFPADGLGLQVDRLPERINFENTLILDESELEDW